MLPPPPPSSTQTVTVPRDCARLAAELAAVTEVSERAVWAMYDAMRGAVTGGRKTAAGRRR